MSTKYSFHYDPLNGEYDNSLIGDCIWSSNNTREAFPDVMIPYTWSKFRSGFTDMILLPGCLRVRNICGRIYNNASDGRIALMDPVNERIVIFDPDEGNYTRLPLPFPYHFNSNLAFDREDRLMYRADLAHGQLGLTGDLWVFNCRTVEASPQRGADDDRIFWRRIQSLYAAHRSLFPKSLAGAT